MDGVGGALVDASQKKQEEEEEEEEKDIVKEPGAREDSSLKRIGTSKISKALVCHYLIFFNNELPHGNDVNISGHTETIQRWEGTIQGEKVDPSF